MKKIISGILVFIILAAFSVSAFAATEYPFYSEELKLKLTVSNEYSIITKDTPADDPVFERIGISKTEYDAYVQSHSIFFSALDVDWEEEIYIMMTDVSSEIPENDFSLFDTDSIETVYSNMKNSIEAGGGTASDYELYQSTEATYMKVYRTFYMDDVYDLVYYTIIDGNEYYFVLTSYLGEVTPEQEASFLNFINNVDFYNAPVIYAPVVEETESYVEVTEYYDDYDNYDDEYYDDYDSYDEYGNEKKEMPWWGWLLIALGVCALIGIPVVIIVVVIIIVVVVKKKKKKKAAAAENTANPQ